MRVRGEIFADDGLGWNWKLVNFKSLSLSLRLAIRNAKAVLRPAVLLSIWRDA